MKRLAAGLLLLAAVVPGCASPGPATRVLGLRVVAPTVTADSPWEQSSVQEPNVWYDHGVYRMIYSGGWSSEALGYATARHPSGPWAKYAGNPILGSGAGGEAGQVGRSNVFVDTDGQVYVYYSRGTAGDIGAPLIVATGRLPQLTPQGTALAPTTAALSIENTSVVNDHGVYRMIFEAHSSTGAKWQMGYATAGSPLGPFTVQRFPLQSLQRAPGGMYGGPNLTRDGDAWVLLYQATDVAGSLPTDIYRATSTDLVDWTRGQRVVTHPAGRDQAADPYLLHRPRGDYIFWDAVNNTAGTSVLMSVRCLRCRVGPR